ncbi:MAG: sterol desaturase family protein [Spirochaetes bacterium]|nr:sterol desaturase family protein [Spirochaetota bacterium]
MSEQLLSLFQFSEAAVRMTVWIIIFAVMAVWEIAAPRRTLAAAKANRWFSNLVIAFINVVLVRIIFPVVPVALAALAGAKGWGLLNRFEAPAWIEFIIAIALLDLATYLLHVVYHVLPPLWRLHLVHHADLDTDVTTGLRYHPVEIVLSLLVRLSVVSVIGPDPAAVAVYEIVLGGMVMFDHGNVRIPAGIDAVLRHIAVTPDMHRVHHSAAVAETNSNFGFVLSWWDRLLGTYRVEPAAGHEAMTIGLGRYRDAAGLSLPKLIILPVTADTGGYDINRRGPEEADAD